MANTGVGQEMESEKFLISDSDETASLEMISPSLKSSSISEEILSQKGDIINNFNAINATKKNEYGMIKYMTSGIFQIN